MSLTLEIWAMKNALAGEFNLVTGIVAELDQPFL